MTHSSSYPFGTNCNGLDEQGIYILMNTRFKYRSCN